MENTQIQESQLSFVSTLSLVDFKVQHKIGEIKILKNEETGKCFFSYAGKTGAVTSRYPEEPLVKPAVSEVMNPETGECFYLLHNEGQGKAIELERL